MDSVPLDSEMVFRMTEVPEFGWHAPWCRLIDLHTMAQVFQDRHPYSWFFEENDSCSCGFTAYANAHQAEQGMTFFHRPADSQP